jgi:hypothetical protein
MNKHGYTNLFFDLQAPLYNPTSIVPLRDDLLFVVENGGLSAIDVSQLGIDMQNMQRPVSPVSKKSIFPSLPNGMKLDSVIVVARN